MKRYGATSLCLGVGGVQYGLGFGLMIYEASLGAGCCCIQCVASICLNKCSEDTMYFVSIISAVHWKHFVSEFLRQIFDALHVYFKRPLTNSLQPTYTKPWRNRLYYIARLASLLHHSRPLQSSTSTPSTASDELRSSVLAANAASTRSAGSTKRVTRAST